jgi:hypothetical protein
MKQKIASILCSMFGYRIVGERETERYYFVRLNDSMITDVVLRELIEQGFDFIIDLDDCTDRQISIAFVKM